MRRSHKSWYVVETECHGEVHFHYVFTRTAASATAEAREREAQSWQGNYVVTVNRVDVQA